MCLRGRIKGYKAATDRLREGQNIGDSCVRLKRGTHEAEGGHPLGKILAGLEMGCHQHDPLGQLAEPEGHAAWRRARVEDDYPQIHLPGRERAAYRRFRNAVAVGLNDL